MEQPKIFNEIIKSFLKKIILLTCLFFGTNLSAQLPDGSIAPDFIAYDLNGEEHHL